VIADRIRRRLKYVAADRLIPAPDCGMKYMSRHTAFGKLKAMSDAAAMVRKEISQAAERRCASRANELSGISIFKQLRKCL
jgi:hypothetical protein